MTWENDNRCVRELGLNGQSEEKFYGFASMDVLLLKYYVVLKYQDFNVWQERYRKN